MQEYVASQGLETQSMLEATSNNSSPYEFIFCIIQGSPEKQPTGDMIDGWMMDVDR